MTKQELLTAIKEATGQPTKEVQKILHHFQQILLKELKKSGTVNVLDLGQLKISERSARTGINPQTKAKITIPAKKVPKLSASRKLKDYTEGSVQVSVFQYYSE